MEIEVRSPLGLLVTLVDDVDADLAQLSWSMAGGKGSMGKYASRKAKLDGRWTTLYLHRVVAQRMGLTKLVAGRRGGYWRRSVDHANGDKLDNRRANLRLRTRRQQMTNPADRLRSTNTTGAKGVYFDRRPGQAARPWYAQVMVDYRTVNLGTYVTRDEAIVARRQWDEAHV